ncbi:MAG: hypothetical protein IJ879_09695, partial [Muribaculaceae bacterium]|nr:hypothetical protein [Muribaculaceae bacterium]
NTSREGYILRTPVANEFFAIENRQKTGWDTYLPGHGMLVTRVDSTNTSIWSQNKVNCNPDHMYFELLRAGNTPEGDLGSDPFPGSSGNPMLTNDTHPSLKTWGGYANAYNIVGISEADGLISFTVVDDGDIDRLVEDFENMPVTTTTNEANVEGEFTNWTFVKSGVRAPGEGKADGVNSVLMKAPSQFYSTTPVNNNFYMASIDVFNTSTSVARFSLEYSLDGGQNWIKAMTPAGNAAAEVAKGTVSTCYWSLNLNERQNAQFRVYQSATKDKTVYVDNFTLYYSEGGGSIKGDVNGDGEVNIADINALISMILSGQPTSSGDVNEDDEVNIADVNAVIDIILS